MNTEETFIIHDQEFNLQASELSQEELVIAKEYVEITRHLQEIRQLYMMFQYNINCICSKYELMSDGRVLKDGKPALEEEDFIAINALVNNLISGGKTLKESTECYMREHYQEDDSMRKAYMNFCSSIYDSSFPFRFLLRMRDYSQHGHLPVNLTDERYVFDLDRILKKPNFTHNRQIKQQMEKAVEETIDIYGDIPRLSLGMTLVEYVAKLLTIYHRFLISVELKLTDCKEKVREVFENYPRNFFVADGNIPLFVYDIEADGNAHMVFIDEDPVRMLSDVKKEAMAAMEWHVNQLKRWKKECGLSE